MIGTRLGPYEVTARLGEGGMGEVYRARDSRLDRDVAIKVLPAAFVQDADRLARFEREAKLLAQLSHSNIASIFGLEETNGARALVMELVEGPTLAERLERGAIPVEEALAIARQIAEALEAAHEKGIVHRDLKPPNVKVAADDRVKVLDFGLAKATESLTAASPELSQSPTLMGAAAGGTQLGLILGTAGYMAPEQARGRAVDKRADIWAFGVVLYEMLAGRRLFAGDTVAETLAGVLKGEIDLGALPQDVPPSIRALLRRCLERDPKNRLHDIADARLVIDDALAGNEAAEGATPGVWGRRRPESSDGAPMGPATGSSRRRNPTAGRLGWLVLGVLIGTAAVVAAHRLGPGAAGDGVRPFTLRRLTELPGAELTPTLSPDGRSVVYASGAAGNLDLYVQRVNGDRAIPLTTDMADDSQPAFSPDGERIAFRSERDGGGLFVMGATGESVRRVTDAGFDPAWSPDGRELAYATEPVDDPTSRYSVSELWVVEIESGKRRRLLAGDAMQPGWSHDGKRLAYWANTDGQRDLWTVAAEGGEPVAVTQDIATDWSPEWSPDDRWLTFSSDRGGSFNLWRIAIDAATGRARGAPQAVTSSVRGLGFARFSRDGSRLALLASERSYVQTLYAIEPTRPVALRSLRTLRNPSARWCTLSPDGSHLGCSVTGPPEDLVVMRSDGREMRRLTSDLARDRNVFWSPDGKRLAFYSTRVEDWQYWTIGADGSDLRQVTRGFPGPDWTWLTDSRVVILSSDASSTVIHSIATDGLATPASAVETKLPAGFVGLVGCMADHAGVRVACPIAPGQRLISKYAVVDLQRGSFRHLDLTPAGNFFLAVAGWLPDDRRLIVRGLGGLSEVDVETGASRVIAPAAASARVSLSRDGRTLMIEDEVVDSDVWLLEYE